MGSDPSIRSERNRPDVEMRIASESALTLSDLKPASLIAFFSQRLRTTYSGVCLPLRRAVQN